MTRLQRLVAVVVLLAVGWELDRTRPIEPVLVPAVVHPDTIPADTTNPFAPEPGDTARLWAPLPDDSVPPIDMHPLPPVWSV